ncbi:MAG: hypothetical protein JNN15_09945 [Blastocatellia bacterium]|nr:hypothetical protein [Blastocatellia bacterium]
MRKRFFSYLILLFIFLSFSASAQSQKSIKKNGKTVSKVEFSFTANGGAESLGSCIRNQLSLINSVVVVDKDPDWIVDGVALPNMIDGRTVGYTAAFAILKRDLTPKLTTQVYKLTKNRDISTSVAKYLEKEAEKAITLRHHLMLTGSVIDMDHMCMDFVSTFETQHLNAE